jgi:uncharacterized damage-inducible protein DinB
MASIVGSVTGEFKRYKALAEGALSQLNDEQLVATAPGSGNSIATICWHVAANLCSRFTDFLTSDGEKPRRRREEEFEPRVLTQAELLVHWEQGWSALLRTLVALDDSQLSRTITIRGQGLRVDEALLRSLAHVSYHVGQVVYAVRSLRGASWRFLSIPPGQSAAYNAAPRDESPGAHAAWVRRPNGS